MGAKRHLMTQTRCHAKYSVRELADAEVAGCSKSSGCKAAAEKETGAYWGVREGEWRHE
jgi:hypothetical protein